MLQGPGDIMEGPATHLVDRKDEVERVFSQRLLGDFRTVFRDLVEHSEPHSHEHEMGTSFETSFNVSRSSTILDCFVVINTRYNPSSGWYKYLRQAGRPIRDQGIQ